MEARSAGYYQSVKQSVANEEAVRALGQDTWARRMTEQILRDGPEGYCLPTDDDKEFFTDPIPCRVKACDYGV